MDRLQSKFTESQIVAILGEGEAGLPVAEVCRKRSVFSEFQQKSLLADVFLDTFHG